MGLPPGATVEDWDALEEESDASSTFFFSPIRSPRSLSSNENDREEPKGVADEEESESYSIGDDDLGALQDGGTEVGRRLREMFLHKQEVERLQAKQYWRAEWKSDADVNARFNLGDASTLGMWNAMSAIIFLTQFCVGPAVQRALGRELNLKVVGPEHEV
jgi:gamma-tubulin complex component 5